MKKILSYILIFVIVFVNLFAPFSVGIKNKITIDKMVASASSIPFTVETPTTTSDSITVYGYAPNETTFREGSILYVDLYNSSNEKVEEQSINIDSTKQPVNFTAVFSSLTPPGSVYSMRFRIDSSEDVMSGITLRDASGQKVDAKDPSPLNKSAASQSSSITMPECGMSPSTWYSGCVARAIYYILFVPTSYFFALAGIFFDNTFAYSVQDTSYRSSFVTEGWGLVRDFCNMFFIFILLYTAISTILGLHGPSAKQVIVRVVVIGLFINFSLFVTQVIIDASNITARVFYNADTIKITKKGQSNNTFSNATDGGTILAKENENGVISLSEGLVNKVNPQNLIIHSSNINNIDSKSNDISVSNENNGIDTVTFIVVTLLSSAINIVGFIVFLSIGMIFVSRIVGLWIAMILSPLAFFTYIIPSMESINTIGWSKWWSNTLRLAFLAPVFIFFLYIILKFLEIDLWKDINGSSGVAAVIATILPFAFIMVLLMKAKKIATEMSGELGAYATKIGSMAGGLALGAATGGVALLGRSTLGAMGSKIANSKWLAEQEAGGKTALGRWGAKMALKSGDKLQTSSFDVKATGLAGKAAGALGTDLGKAKTGGFKADVVDREAKRTKRVEELKHIASHHDEVHKREVEASKKVLEDKNSAEIQKIDKDLENKRKELNDYPVGTKGREDLEKEIATLKADKDKIVTGGAIAGKTNSDGTNMYNTTDGHISEAEHKKIKEKHEADLSAAEKAKQKTIDTKGGNGVVGSAETNKINAIKKADENKKNKDDEAKKKETEEIDNAKKALTEAENILNERKSNGGSAQDIAAAEKAVEKSRTKLVNTEAAAKASTAQAEKRAKEEYAKEIAAAEQAEKDEITAAEEAEKAAIEQSTKSAEAFATAQRDAANGFGKSIKELNGKITEAQLKVDKANNKIASDYAESLGSTTNQVLNKFMSGATKKATDDTRNKILLGMKTDKIGGTSGGSSSHGSPAAHAAPKAAAAKPADNHGGHH